MAPLLSEPTCALTCDADAVRLFAAIGPTRAALAVAEAELRRYLSEHGTARANGLAVGLREVQVERVEDHVTALGLLAEMVGPFHAASAARTSKSRIVQAMRAAGKSTAETEAFVERLRACAIEGAIQQRMEWTDAIDADRGHRYGRAQRDG